MDQEIDPFECIRAYASWPSYRGEMLFWFNGDTAGYPIWLADHPHDYVVLLSRIVRVGDLPYRPGAESDRAATESIHRVLHRSVCDAVRHPQHGPARICGPHDELIADLAGEDMVTCAECLSA